MAKDFNGGISQSQYDGLVQALEDVSNAVFRAMKVLAKEERTASKVEDGTLSPASQTCNEIKTARQAAETLIGDIRTAGSLIQSLKIAENKLGALSTALEELETKYPVVMGALAGPC